MTSRPGFQTIQLGVASSLVFALALIFSGCQDRTLDEYNRDKVAENIRRIESISGDYRGVLYSGDDGAPLGAVELSLSPDTSVGESSDKTSSSQQARVKGDFSFDGAVRTYLSFENADYDWTRGTIRATLVRDGELQTVDLTANIQGDSFTGEIEANTYRGKKARLELIKNGPARDGQSVIGDHPKIPSTGSELAGLFVSETTPNRSISILDTRTLSDYQIFLSYFSPVTVLRVTLNYSDVVSWTFPVVEWDSRIGHFKGDLNLAQTTLKLDCARVRGSKGQSGWGCSFKSSNRGELFYEVFVPSTDGDKKPKPENP